MPSLRPSLLLSVCLHIAVMLSVMLWQGTPALHDQPQRHSGHRLAAAPPMQALLHLTLAPPASAVATATPKLVATPPPPAQPPALLRPQPAPLAKALPQPALVPPQSPASLESSEPALPASNTGVFVEQLHAQPPLAALRLGLSGVVIINIHWSPADTQASFTIAQSSGNPLLDAAALQAVEQHWEQYLADHPQATAAAVTASRGTAVRTLRVVFS